MKKIEAILRHERLQEVQDALDQLGVSGLTVSEVVGCGRQKGYTEQYRGVRANISLLPKIKVESVVPSDVVDDAVEAIVAAARTGAIGDGRVFVYDVDQSIRIRTGEDGEESVRHEEPVGWCTPDACMTIPVRPVRDRSRRRRPEGAARCDAVARLPATWAVPVSPR